jgi:hypothetical protein
MKSICPISSCLKFGSYDTELVRQKENVRRIERQIENILFNPEQIHVLCKITDRRLKPVSQRLSLSHKEKS